MRSVVIHGFEHSLRLKNRLLGVGWHRDATRHFGAGGIDEAEALCSAAGADLLAFVRPPAGVPAEGLTMRSLGQDREIAFASPLPSGHVVNDRVVARLIPARRPRADGKALVFHHAFLQKRWPVWSWFVAPLAERYPVILMAAPYHFERTPDGWFPGEGTINPNPWRLFQSIRQWSWDQKALTRALTESFHLEPAAVIGFSLGAFQSLLVASAGEFAGLPLISIACTNRYAFGLRHGVLGRGTLEGLRRAGIDGERLDRMVEAIQLERYVDRLRDREILFIAGRHDRVDPPPSAERLEAELRPARSVWLDSGHGSVLLERARIAREVFQFLDARGTTSATTPS
jgi:pimeloyl-ACP methyl ester carboxylesterase